MKILRRALSVVAVAFTLGSVAEPLAAPVTIAQARSSHVWIAPYKGKKYHFSKKCRGLRRARKVKRVTLKWAKKHHYKQCRIRGCY
ncbi:hypothetical protein [Levilactobacillus huananensis]|uniref:hypothetical protein n=1 Tax=Levilactobacillus huananensis TaxID=2486019 RepID=UPI000F7AEFB4|nr:hypothetical protein [Levilactobacillus huananensis]